MSVVGVLKPSWHVNVFPNPIYLFSQTSESFFINFKFILIFAKLNVGVFSLDYDMYRSLLLIKRCLLMFTLDFVYIVSIYYVFILYIICYLLTRLVY